MVVLGVRRKRNKEAADFSRKVESISPKSDNQAEVPFIKKKKKK